MPLRINLRPYEQVMINGAVITNLKRRAQLVVHNDAQILQGRYVMKAEAANSPVRRIYFATQMAYILAEHPDQAQPWIDQFLDRLADVMAIVDNQQIIHQLVECGQMVHNKMYYKAVRALLPVIEYEEQMFARIGAPLPPAFGDGLNPPPEEAGHKGGHADHDED